VSQIIRTTEEAIASASDLAAIFAAQAADRDLSRTLPAAPLESLSASGLLGITVPKRFGGPELPISAAVEVFMILAAADASIAQIPHSHFVFLDALRLDGSDEQQARYFSEALAGARFANAQSERGGRTIAEDATALHRHRDGGWTLKGEKFYCTGALFAHWLVVRAVVVGEPPLASGSARKALAYIRRDSPGVTVEDDWNGMGQRTTASGTVRLDDVAVEEAQIVPYSDIFSRPTTYGARAQVLHAALDVGIARGATEAMVTQVGRSRPWFEAAVEEAADDPLVAQEAGELEIVVRGAEALTRDAAAAIDAADAHLTDELTARASVATAVAKVVAARASLDAASRLFELGGTRSAAAPLNLSRYWRDARTHTLHDPIRWKVQHIGRWRLSGTPPPRHGQL
jgi:SfnB family sulfur acquisition oxidoreductase